MTLKDGPVFGIGERSKGERKWLRAGESFQSWVVVGFRDDDNKVVVLRNGETRVELELDGAVILADTPESRAAQREAERLRELFPVHLILSQTVLAQSADHPAESAPVKAGSEPVAKP
jgi:hypothetical protein